mgnify:CR=1 FL=1
MTKTETLGLVVPAFFLKFLIKERAKINLRSSVKIRIIGAETLNIWKGQG